MNPKLHRQATRAQPRLLLTFEPGRLAPVACDVLASDYDEQVRLEARLELLLRLFAALEREAA